MGTVVAMAPVVEKPITIGAYTLTETGLEVQGRPTFDEHGAIGEIIRRAHKASGWWLADWLAYGERRPEWKERLEQMIDATKYSSKTLENVRSVGRAIDKSRRREDVDFSTHEVVAKLEPEDQVEWLERAASEGWSRNDLRRKIKTWEKEKNVSGQAPEMVDVEVSVVLTVEASSSFAAEQAAWDLVKGVLEQAGVGKKIKVIAAHARTR